MNQRRSLLLGLAAWCAAAVVGFGQTALPPREQFHLFLLVGQSNMAGRGEVEEQDRTPNRRVLMLTREGTWAPAVDPMHYDKPVAGVGLGRTFAMKVSEARPGVTVGLIPCAVGGSPIDAWKPSIFYEPTKSYPWDDAMRRARVALKAGVLKGILWHQGESDSTEELAPGYEAKLHDLIARMRRELGAEDVPFVAGQLGQFEGAPWNEPRKVVDRAHRELPGEVKGTAFVGSEGLKDKGDQVHFDAASYRELGRRFAAAYLGMGK